MRLKKVCHEPNHLRLHVISKEEAVTAGLAQPQTPYMPLCPTKNTSLQSLGFLNSPV